MLDSNNSFNKGGKVKPSASEVDAKHSQAKEREKMRKAREEHERQVWLAGHRQ